MIEDARELHDAAHAALHRCWSAAVGTDGYSKQDWIVIEFQMHAGCSSGCLVRKVYPKVAP